MSKEIPCIKPVTELRNNFNEVADLCRDEHEPVFLTRNGHPDLVLMSQALYESRMTRLEVYEKLWAAQEEIRSGKPLIPFDDAMAKLRIKYGGIQ